MDHGGWNNASCFCIFPGNSGNHDRNRRVNVGDGMITLLDILKIDNTNLNTYSAYIHGDYMNPDISPSRDITYPETKSISYGDLTEITLKENLDNTPIDELFLMCRYFGFSDYDNSCMVERSNHKIFMEEYGDLAFVFSVYGGYGTTDIAISLKGLLDPANEEKAQSIIDVLNGLNDYPCIDDEDMSNMEYDAFLEALDSFAIRECNDLLSYQYLMDVYDYDSDKLKEVLLESDRNLNYPSYEIESGGSCYIDTKRLIEKVTLNQYTACLIDFELKGDLS